MTNAHTQEVLATEGVTLDQALAFHLSSRMFPAVHEVFYPEIRQAIDLVAEGDPLEPVVLPNHVILAAADVVSQLRLDDFVQARIEGGEWA